jgi:hypothetical protein
MNIDEHVIRVRAYEMWLAKGCPMGTALQDWLEAERTLVPPAPIAQTAKPARKARAPRKPAAPKQRRTAKN